MDCLQCILLNLILFLTRFLDGSSTMILHALENPTNLIKDDFSFYKQPCSPITDQFTVHLYC